MGMLHAQFRGCHWISTLMQCAMTSSVIRSPYGDQKQNSYPEIYFQFKFIYLPGYIQLIPPSSLVNTFLKPLFFIIALAFRIEIPPVTVHDQLFILFKCRQESFSIYIQHPLNVSTSGVNPHS